MRKRFLNAFASGLLLAFFLLNPNISQGQKLRWFIPPYNVNTTSSVFLTTSAPVSYTTTTPYFQSDAAYDDFGNPLFYVMDYGIYNSAGTWAASLPTYYDPSLNYEPCSAPDATSDQYSRMYTNPTGEMAIVPVPGQCNKYYVIYGMYSQAMGGNALLYVIVDVSGTTVTMSGTNVVNLGPAPYFCGTKTNATLISTFSGEVDVEFAVSKILQFGAEDRYLFTAARDGISRFTITNSGIGSKQTLMSSLVNNSTYSLTDYDFAAMDIDLSNDQLKLVWASGMATSYTSDRNLYEMTLNTTYGYSSVKRYTCSTLVYGVEYDATASRLYASTTGGVYYSLTSGSSMSTLVTGTSASYEQSNLEQLRNGNIAVCNKTNNTIQQIKLTGSTYSIVNSTVPAYCNVNPKTIYRLPNQVDGDSYLRNASSTFTIGGQSAVNCANALQFLTCNTMLMARSSTGPVTGYKVRVRSMSNCSTYTSGSGQLGTFETAWYSPAQAYQINNLKVLPGTNGTWLSNPAHTGLYEVTLFTKNGCGTETSQTSYVNLSPAPSAANINLTLNVSGVQCPGATIGAKCGVGDYAGSYNIGTSGTYGSLNITKLARRIDEVNCTTGAIIATPLNEALTSVPAVSSATGLVLNDIEISGSTGYFAGKDNRCFKLTITAENACAVSASDFAFFWLNPSLFKQTNGVETIVSNEDELVLMGNPVNNNVAFIANLSENKSISCTITDISGRKLDSKVIQGNAGVNHTNFDVSTYASGIYIYHAIIGNKTTSGKFIKQ